MYSTKISNRRYYATMRTSRAITRLLRAETPIEKARARRWINVWRILANMDAIGKR